MRAVWLAALLVAALAACTYDPGTPPILADAAADTIVTDAAADVPGASIDTPPAPTDAPPDLAASEDTPPAPPPDTAPADVAPPDTSPPADVAPVCTPKLPAMIFNATPAMTCGSVCNPTNAMSADGRVAGLECTGGGSVQIDGKFVTACIGADFGAVMALDPLVVRMARTSSACGTACTLCNTGDTALVFHGRDRTQLQFAAEIAVSNTVTEYPIRAGATSRFVVVCRGGSGAHRDDVVVDAIASRAGCN